MLVYFVEDDQEISYIIDKTLERTGLTRQGFSTGQSFFEAYEQKKPNLILLDVMLPDTNGIEILKIIRQTDKTIPIIIISALFSEMDKVHALAAGADDYVTKPFSVLELQARIQSRLRNVVTDKFIVGNIEIDLNEYLAYIDGINLNLTNTQYEILVFLLKNKTRVLKKEEIFSAVWKTDYMGETRTLDMHIATLRQILRKAKSNISIRTIRGLGYKIEGSY